MTMSPLRPPLPLLPSQSFGSECVLSQAYLRKVVRDSGIVDDVLMDLRHREKQKLLKASAGGGRSTQVRSLTSLSPTSLSPTSLSQVSLSVSALLQSL